MAADDFAHESANEIERLEALVAGDLRSAALPALAEANRKAGNAAEAERIARRGLDANPACATLHVTLSLALFDLDRAEEARRQLELALEAQTGTASPELGSAPTPTRAPAPGWRALPPVPAAPPEILEAIGDSEIEAAFDSASPEREEMISADAIAQAAVQQVDFESGDEADSEEIPIVTHTVANLLEQQGHRDGARTLRELLGAPRDCEPPSPDPGHEEGRSTVISTLERWLQNLRRGVV